LFLVSSPFDKTVLVAGGSFFVTKETIILTLI
jgi:hypothetical protein